MIAALPWRNKVIFFITSILLNIALITFIFWSQKIYNLRHYSSDEYLELGGGDGYR